MNYIEVIFTSTPQNETINDVLSAGLAEIGFESFVSSEKGLTAYIKEESFDRAKVDILIGDFPLEAKIDYVTSRIEGQDWNEEWEKNYFKPLVIDDRCIIQSSFHNEPATYEYNIYIDPKMAFGTGHHQTTELVIRQMLSFDFSGKQVLDMGCGTAILAILASMRGASLVKAIDIDQWAYDNAVENLQVNHVNNVKVEIGGSELLGNEMFDVILANINRNILLADIDKYSAVLTEGGDLFMSGFYEKDIQAIKDKCADNRLVFIDHTTKDEWAVVRFGKA